MLCRLTSYNVELDVVQAQGIIHAMNYLMLAGVWLSTYDPWSVLGARYSSRIVQLFCYQKFLKEKSVRRNRSKSKIQ